MVDILGSIDDKIEYYENFIRKLEYEGELLFKNIFENPSIEKEKISLSSIAEFYSGYSYSGDELCELSATGLVTIKNFDRKGGFKIDGFKPINITGKVKPTMYANVGDLIVAHTDLTQNADIIGNPILLHNISAHKEVVISTDLVKVESKIIPNELLYYILKSSEFKAHALGFCSGTTVLHLNKNALKKYSFNMPTDKMMIFNLCKKLILIFNRIENAIIEVQKLNELKQLYLKKFFG